MFAYKTNSADYLDYVASVLTRDEILANPDLCLLLENEYIKDNMEIALRWQAAKTGDYQDKYEFVEYLLCNGPELDADTILHYRAKCQTEPVYMEIAYSYLSNPETLKLIRKDKYNKESDSCFNNPCFYLGRFSSVMGSIGDVKATYSPFNTIADWINSVSFEKQAEAQYGKQLQQGLITQEEYDKKIEEAKLKDKELESQRTMTGGDLVATPSGKPVPTGTDVANNMPAVGGSRPCFAQAIIPSITKGWNMLVGQILEGDAEFTNELINKSNCLLNSKRVGDWMSLSVAKWIDIPTKANVHRHLGDCARLWSQVRRMRLFGSENNYNNITAEMKAGDKNVLGAPNSDTSVANPKPQAVETSSTVSTSDEANRVNYTK